MITELNEDADRLAFSCVVCHHDNVSKLSDLRLAGKEWNSVVVGVCTRCSATSVGLAPLSEVDDDAAEPKLTCILVGYLAKKNQFHTGDDSPSSETKDKLKKFYRKAKIDNLVRVATKTVAGSKRSFAQDNAKRESIARAISPAIRAEKQAIGSIRKAEQVRTAKNEETVIKNRQLDQFAKNITAIGELKSLSTKRSELFSAQDRTIIAEAESAIRDTRIDDVQKKLNKLLKRLKADQVRPSELVRNLP
jgi:hypothetical protein